MDGVPRDSGETGMPAGGDWRERVAQLGREWGFGDRPLLVSVDRMDYTKGIPERLKSFRLLLRRFPELRRQITLVQVVVPSREEIPNYKELRLEVELLVSQINGEFTESGWVPIHYMHRNPVVKGLAKISEDWPWSSARYYKHNEEGSVKIEFERLVDQDNE